MHLSVSLCLSLYIIKYDMRALSPPVFFTEELLPSITQPPVPDLDTNQNLSEENLPAVDLK